MLAHYGEFFIGLGSIHLLAQQAIARFDEAWAHGPVLTAYVRGHVGVVVTTAKVAATRIGLDLTNRMLEMTGTHVTYGAFVLDHF